jgi:hypothetical protein
MTEFYWWIEKISCRQVSLLCNSSCGCVVLLFVVRGLSACLGCWTWDVYLLFNPGVNGRSLIKYYEFKVNQAVYLLLKLDAMPTCIKLRLGVCSIETDYRTPTRVHSTCQFQTCPFHAVSQVLGSPNQGRRLAPAVCRATVVDRSDLAASQERLFAKIQTSKDLHFQNIFLCQAMTWQ